MLTCDVQAFVEEVEGVSAEDLVVYHGGKPLEDGLSLMTLGNLATLQVEVRLLGGEFFCYKKLCN
jgi:hypothetical protein